MTLHTPVALQPATGDPDATYSAQEYRQLINSLMAAGGVPLDSQGCLGSGQLQVTQRGAGANFSVDISPGRAFILGDDIASQGQYMVWNDATFNLATPGAPASGTRTHRVVAQVRDKLANGSFTTYDWQFALLQDTGSGEPAEPASAITLAHVAIAAGQASVTNTNITDARPQLAQAGEVYTPVLGNAGSFTYTTQDGWYFKAGKLVTFNAFIVGNAAGSGGATVTMSLPYEPARTGRQIIPMSGVNITGGNGLFYGNVLAGNTGAVIDSIRLFSSTTGIVGTGLQAGAILVAQGMYLAV